MRIIIFLCCFFISCKTSNRLQVRFINSEIIRDSSVINNKTFIATSEYYFIKNYSNTIKNDILIHKYVLRKLKKIHLNSNVYEILFYKEPSSFKKQAGSNFSKDDIKEEELLYAFYWENGKYSGKEKFYFPDDKDGNKIKVSIKLDSIIK